MDCHWHRGTAAPRHRSGRWMLDRGLWRRHTTGPTWRVRRVPVGQGIRWWNLINAKVRLIEIIWIYLNVLPGCTRIYLVVRLDYAWFIMIYFSFNDHSNVHSRGCSWRFCGIFQSKKSWAWRDPCRPILLSANVRLAWFLCRIQTCPDSAWCLTLLDL